MGRAGGADASTRRIGAVLLAVLAAAALLQVVDGARFTRLLSDRTFPDTPVDLGTTIERERRFSVYSELRAAAPGARASIPTDMSGCRPPTT